MVESINQQVNLMYFYSVLIQCIAKTLWSARGIVSCNFRASKVCVVMVKINLFN